MDAHNIQIKASQMLAQQRNAGNKDFSVLCKTEEEATEFIRAFNSIGCRAVRLQGAALQVQVHIN